jgi:hypothetical protein
MALLPRKPRKQLAPKLTDMVESAKAEIARNQAIFDGWMLEAKDG